MFHSFYLILFQFIIHHILIFFLNAIPSGDDQMLIAFVKNDQKVQISEYSKQKCEAHLGIVYYMKKNWQCDKIAKEFEEYERTECQKYRKYLDILYEYLFREYAGIPTVKPKFVFKEEIEINGPIIYAVNCLVHISQFYFIKWAGQRIEYKLNNLFNHRFLPNLLNEKRLNYKLKLENKIKLPINEIILQLAIDTANECQTNESLDGIIFKNYGENFEKYLEEIFKKAEERAKKAYQDNQWHVDDDKHLVIIYSKFDDYSTWTEDALFSEFVKGLATNFGKFIKMAKEYSNYLGRIKEEEHIHCFDRDMISYGLCEIEKMKKHLTQKYEAHLGVVYLMQKNWHCEKLGKKFNVYERKICQKYRKYLDILYEYLFRLYAQATNPKVSKQLPPLVKPIFIGGEYIPVPLSLIEVAQRLSHTSAEVFCKAEIHFLHIELLNEEELNYQIKKRENEEKDQNWLNKWTQNLMEKMKGQKNVKKGKEILNGEPTDNKMKENGQKSTDKNETEIANLWEEFQQKMEKICQKTKENAKEEKKKLEKALTKAKDEAERQILEQEYKKKFGTFNSSPFHKIFWLF